MIRVDGLRYHIGNFDLDLSLEIGKEEYFVLFGITGCGKTSLLECVCGLRPVSAGRVIVAGADVTHAEPRSRRIGYVPQDGALFTHLSVRENIGFALRVRGEARAEKDRVVRELAGKLGIEHLLDRPIAGLSGGERQRVALGRALVGQPRALLLDEPVCALDEYTRDAVCRTIVQVHREARIPVVHVCHSFEEARLVADRMAVMRDGRIVQVGAPDDLVTAPRDGYVARILRLENIFVGQGVRQNGAVGIRVADLMIPLDVPEQPALSEVEGPVQFVVHPWDVSVCSGRQDPSLLVVEGAVSECSRLGAVVKIRIEGVLPLTAHIPRGQVDVAAVKSGTPIRLGFSPKAVHLLALGEHVDKKG